MQTCPVLVLKRSSHKKGTKTVCRSCLKRSTIQLGRSIRLGRTRRIRVRCRHKSCIFLGVRSTKFRGLPAISRHSGCLKVISRSRWRWMTLWLRWWSIFRMITICMRIFSRQEIQKERGIRRNFWLLRVTMNVSIGISLKQNRKNSPTTESS